MRKFLFLLILINFFVALKSQTDTLNKINVNGKKQGFWKQYLDINACPTDSINAYYFGYDLYDNGVRLIGYFNDKLKFKKNGRLENNQPACIKGNPVLINGIFKWHNKKTNRIYLIESYVNGYPDKIEYFTKSAHKNDTIFYLTEYVDYSMKYNNEFGTSFYKFLRKEKTDEYWFRKVDGKWKYYKNH